MVGGVAELPRRLPIQTCLGLVGKASYADPFGLNREHGGIVMSSQGAQPNPRCRPSEGNLAAQLERSRKGFLLSPVWAQ